jgi:hypothetical protein
MKKRLVLLAELARARRAAIEPEPWVPTDEEKTAIAKGTLIAIPFRGGPCVLIHLEGKASAK